MIKNKLKINDSNTEFIIFRSPLLKQNLSYLSVSVGDMQVSPSSKVRDLGVVFDQYLTFHDHISGICKSTYFHLRGIGIIRNLLTFDAAAQLIHALITSRLDLCNSILYNLPNKQIGRLQRIQNQAARMLKRIPRRTHITPVLRELHWLRIHDIIIFKFLLLIHKAVNNTAPEYLCDLISLNVKITTIRTRASFDPCLLCVPPISKTCANSFFDRSFVYAAPTLWNALDLDIRLLPFDALKKESRHIFIGSTLKIVYYCIYIMCMLFMFLQCVSTVIIVYIIISPLNSYLYIHWIILLLLSINSIGIICINTD